MPDSVTSSLFWKMGFCGVILAAKILKQIASTVNREGPNIKNDDDTIELLKLCRVYSQIMTLRMTGLYLLEDIYEKHYDEEGCVLCRAAKNEFQLTQKNGAKFLQFFQKPKPSMAHLAVSITDEYFDLIDCLDILGIDPYHSQINFVESDSCWLMYNKQYKDYFVGLYDFGWGYGYGASGYAKSSRQSLGDKALLLISQGDDGFDEFLKLSPPVDDPYFGYYGFPENDNKLYLEEELDEDDEGRHHFRMVKTTKNTYYILSAYTYNPLQMHPNVWMIYADQIPVDMTYALWRFEEVESGNCAKRKAALLGDKKK